MSHLEQIPCVEVLSSVVFIIEGAIEETANPSAIQGHLLTCPNCQAEIAHEQQMHSLLQDVLRRSCDEKTPDEIYSHIHQQLLAQNSQGSSSGQGMSEVVTHFSMTEVSIEIDEFGNIEHREIQIEQTHIQHFIDDDSGETN
jgi:hypothetical protein